MRAWIYAVFLLSGFAALLYQIVWQRALYAIYGINIESVTMVVTAFMLGSGVGSVAGGVVSKDPKRPVLLMFSLVELGIGLFGAVSLSVFHAVGEATLGMSAVATFVVTFLLVLVPTLLMGSTLPLLVAHLVRSSKNVGKSVGTLYFVNTLGSAFASAAAVLFVMKSAGLNGHGAGRGGAQRHGEPPRVRRASPLAAPGRDRRRRSPRVAATVAGGRRMSFVLALVVAGVSGFIALSYEIVWYRVIAFESWGSARRVRALARGVSVRPRDRLARRRSLLQGRREARRQAPAPRARALRARRERGGVGGGAVLRLHGEDRRRLARGARPRGARGGVARRDPAARRALRHRARRPRRRSVSVTCILQTSSGRRSGSLLTGFVFFDAWPLRTTGIVIALVGLALVALLVALSDLSRGGRGARGSPARCAVAVLARGPARHARTTASGSASSTSRISRHDTKFAEIIETKSGVITVTQDGTVYGGGAYDGRFNTSIRCDRNGIMRAYGIGAMHPAPKKVLMIGLASGSWATVIEHLPGLEHLTIVEINPGYNRLIAGHPEVAGVLTDPKVDIVIDDGRRWLNRHPDRALRRDRHEHDLALARAHHRSPLGRVHEPRARAPLAGRLLLLQHHVVRGRAEDGSHRVAVLRCACTTSWP